MSEQNDQIGIKRLDHVCWAVESVDDVLPLLTGLMGMTVEGRFENPDVGFRGVGLRVPGGTAHFELLEPTGADSYLHRFLRDRGPGLHHVTFEVEDIERAASAIREFGIEPMGGVQRSHGWAETYIHPRDSGGVLFQFYVEEEPHEHPHADDQVSHSHEYEAQVDSGDGDEVDYYTMSDDQELLTVRDVARRCHRSEETVRRWIWSGKLPARKLGNQLFVAASDLARIQPGLRVSEQNIAYRPTAGGRGGLNRRKSMDKVTKRLFEEYGYSPIVEDIREHRGQLLPSKKEALRHIEEDEAFQDEMLEKYGTVDVVDLLRQVREE